uniref:Transmembrane protein 268 n=1 Tax=Latimeria chalumnae TaxID=7897 RepID=H2ZUF9_LATCH
LLCPPLSLSLSLSPSLSSFSVSLPLSSPAPYDGEVILTLSTSPTWWSPAFNLDSCTETFSSYGLQVPLEDFQLPISRALLKPEVRRYMMFSSRSFLMILTPILYLVTWCSLYSTFHFYLGRRLDPYIVQFCLLLSLVSVFIVVAFLAVVHIQNKKLNMSTDARLMWANENLMKYKVLAGVLDTLNNCSSTLHLYFVCFDLQRCQERLETLLTTALQSRLRRKLGFMHVVMKTAPAEVMEERDSEETPLLVADGEIGVPERQSEATHAPSFNTVVGLFPGESAQPFQELAHQLLIVYSGLYVKLRATAQLPVTSESLHARWASIPCLCQFIESQVLRNKCCFSLFP